MKHPREDATGTDRSGDPLVSLDDALLPVRDALFGAGWNVYKAVHVGNPAPMVAKMQQRISDPQPGDYVGIGDTAYKRDLPDDTRAQRCGYLVAIRDEWMHTGEEWQENLRVNAEDSIMGWGPEERPVERGVIYVQYGPEPGDVCRWVNASAFVVPLGVKELIP